MELIKEEIKIVKMWADAAKGERPMDEAEEELFNKIKQECGIEQYQWDYEVERAKEMLEVYKTIPMGFFGAAHISQTIDRYESGERSQDLYETLESIE